jgi:hypothetical protein
MKRVPLLAFGIRDDDQLYYYYYYKKKLIGKGKTMYEDLLYMIAVFALDNASLGSANYKAK